MVEGSVSAGSMAARERRFYTRMAWLLVALVFIGFAPSFYLKPLGLSYPRPNPPLIANLLLHGTVFTAWVAIFLAQVSLVAAGRRDLHRSLGVVGFSLGVAMVPVMYITAVWQVARASQPPYTDPLTWTAVPLVGMPVFALVLWLGWQSTRRDLQAHKRLMLSLMIMLTQPAIARLPLAPPSITSFAVICSLSWFLFVPLFIWDLRSRGAVQWASKLGAGLYALVIAAQVFFLATPGLWSSFAVHLPGVRS
ncbi:MAG: hypothetical protein ABIM50_02810 [Novosphingobium sp.]